MKRSKEIVRENLVVGYWELIPMKSGAEFSYLQYIAKDRVAEKIPAAKKQMNYWWTEEMVKLNV